MLFIEDLARAMAWLLALVMAVNVLFVCFVFYRRAKQRRFHLIKDSARKQTESAVRAFAGGGMTLNATTAALGSMTSLAAREAFMDVVAQTRTPENIGALSELMIAVGTVDRWARQGFGRRRGKLLVAAAIQRKSPDDVPAGPVLGVIRRRKFFAVRRALAIDALGQLSPEFAYVFMTAALNDLSSEVRSIAVVRLAGTRQQSAIPKLLDELQRLVTEQSDVSWRSLKIALSTFGMGDLDRFLPFLTHQHPRVRFCTVDIIREICTREAGKTMLNKADFSPAFYSAFLEKVVNDPWHDVRARATSVVKHFRDSRARQALRALLTDDSEFVRMHAVRACADRFYGDLVPDVVARLQDQSWRVQEAAVKMLLDFGGAAREELYRQFIESDDADLCDQIADAVQRGGLMPQLLRALGSTSAEADAASAVVRRFAELGKTSFFVDALASVSDVRVSTTLMDALAMSPTVEYLNVLEGLSTRNLGPIGTKASLLLAESRGEGAS